MSSSPWTEPNISAPRKSIVTIARRGNGEKEYFHAMLGATLVAPGHDKVISPCARAVRVVNGHFIFVCKPSSHPLIQEYLTGVELQTHDHTVKRGKLR